jgi:heme exporter protein D
MYWKSIDDFLAMGGYGFYVWVSFGLTFLLMLIEIILLNKRAKQFSNSQSSSIEET